MSKPENRNDAPGSLRYERKFHINGYSLREVEQVVKLHPSIFRRTFPTREVNNIYIDTDQLSCYTANIEGESPRAKYRFRWYGGLDSQSSPLNLEIKRKFGHVGDKIHWHCGCWNDWTNISTNAVGSILESLPKGAVLHADRLRYFSCVLANRYVRQYYVSADGVFRITVDHNLSYFGFRCGELDRNREIFDKSIILELKYDREDDSKATQVTNEIPYRVSRVSKYVLGVDHLRSNHFR